MMSHNDADRDIHFSFLLILMKGPYSPCSTETVKVGLMWCVASIVKCTTDRSCGVSSYFIPYPHCSNLLSFPRRNRTRKCDLIDSPQSVQWLVFRRSRSFRRRNLRFGLMSRELSCTRRMLWKLELSLWTSLAILELQNWNSILKWKKPVANKV